MATRRPQSPKTETKSVEKAAVPSPAKAAAARKSTTTTTRNAPRRSEVSEDMRRGMIAQAAYLRAERRGFTGGNEVEDWLAAEAEVDSLLKAESRGTAQ